MTSQLIRMTVNGRDREVHVDPWRSLLHVLREQLGLTSVKLGCEAGECGACTVLLDGAPVVSCVALGVDADGRTVETVEGISEADRLHPLQEEFLRLSAFQCGYCAPGFIMSAKALLAETPNPTEAEIRGAIAGNLCRCTAYVGIVKAIGEVASTERS
jgi:aerobic carbon-monoxide dehydrogenase small subunit